MYSGWLQFYVQDAAEEIPSVKTLDQHETAATPDALMNTSEEQADAADALDVNTSFDWTNAPEPSNTSSSEQVTLQKPILNQPITP